MSYTVEISVSCSWAISPVIHIGSHPIDRPTRATPTAHETCLSHDGGFDELKRSSASNEWQHAKRLHCCCSPLRWSPSMVQ
mmetsp:Transcript_51114/g.101715  ORF Transcript_51114/g.101715 Transcript_51114/m.101715 type:complete len:81 (-) Transcript_51114:332-574(-)